MTRALGAAIAVVLAAGIAGAIAADDGGPLDQGSAERCGSDLADEAGLDPRSAAAVIDGDTWRITVALSDGALALVVRRADGRVLEAATVGPGGPQPLDRDARLAIYERGC